MSAIEFHLCEGKLVASLWHHMSSIFVMMLSSVFVTALSYGPMLDFLVLEWYYYCSQYKHYVVLCWDILRNTYVVSRWDILKKLCAILFQLFLSFYPLRLILQELSGNSQSVTCFVFCKNANYHETCISPTPVNYVTYWALAHPILTKSYRLISYISRMDLALLLLIGVLCWIDRLTLLMVGDLI